MTDEGTPRIPREPLREILHRVDKAESPEPVPFMPAPEQAKARLRPPAPMPDVTDLEMEKVVQQVAHDASRNVVRRSQARRDACTVVARAMARRGGDITIWTMDDADTAWAIADLLQKRQDREPEKKDLDFEPDNVA